MNHTVSGFQVVIPARLASTRLPRKVLLPLAGKPVMQWVWQAAQTAGAQGVCIAADTEEVADIARSFGAQVVMTRAEHQSGTDRAAEVAQQLGWGDQQIVVNVQGDEPLLPPALIALAAQRLTLDPAAHLATLAHPIHSAVDFANPNVVKVVISDAQRALYFSRAPIPWWRDGSQPGLAALPTQLPVLRHIGLYAYRVAALKQLAALPPSPLEQCEALEQLRALAAGMHISLGIADSAPPHGVDTQADLDALNARLAIK